MHIFIIVSIACAIYGFVAKREEFVLFGAAILIFVLIPILTSMIPFLTRMHQRLLNMILFMGSFSFLANRLRNR